MKKRLAVLLVVIMAFLLGTATLASADAAAYDISPAGYYVYVATPDGGLNMRYGPGSDYSKVMDKRIPDGTKLYITYTSGNWGETSYEGNTGWVYLPQTKRTAPAAKTYEKKEAGYYVYVATPDGGLNMRQGPDSSYSTVMEKRIPDGVELWIEYVSGNWGYTSFEGNEGWVYLPQTTTNPPAADPVSQPVNEPVEPEVENNSEQLIPEETNQPEEITEQVNESMTNSILLIALLLLGIVFIAVVLLVVINKKRR